MNLLQRLARFFKRSPEYDAAVVERLLKGARNAGEPMTGDEAQRRIDGLFERSRRARKEGE